MEKVSLMEKKVLWIKRFCRKIFYVFYVPTIFMFWPDTIDMTHQRPTHVSTPQRSLCSFTTSPNFRLTFSGGIFIDGKLPRTYKIKNLKKTLASKLLKAHIRISKGSRLAWAVKTSSNRQRTANAERWKERKIPTSSILNPQSSLFTLHHIIDKFLL